jgi:hypothetical protein
MITRHGRTLSKVNFDKMTFEKLLLFKMTSWQKGLAPLFYIFEKQNKLRSLEPALNERAGNPY